MCPQYHGVSEWMVSMPLRLRIYNIQCFSWEVVAIVVIVDGNAVLGGPTARVEPTSYHKVKKRKKKKNVILCLKILTIFLTVSLSSPDIDFHSSPTCDIRPNLNGVDILCIVGDTEWPKGLVEGTLHAPLRSKVGKNLSFLWKPKIISLNLIIMYIAFLPPCKSSSDQWILEYFHHVSLPPPKCGTARWPHRRRSFLVWKPAFLLQTRSARTKNYTIALGNGRDSYPRDAGMPWRRRLCIWNDIIYY